MGKIALNVKVERERHHIKKDYIFHEWVVDTDSLKVPQVKNYVQ